jgi:hypothetical protein
MCFKFPRSDDELCPLGQEYRGNSSGGTWLSKNQRTRSNSESGIFG